LLSIVQRSKSKSEELQHQWDVHKQQLDIDYQQTFNTTKELEKLSVNNKEPSILEKLETTQANILQKQALLKQLQKNFNSLKTDEHTREFYTSRILDLVKQIEKLRTGVDAVIEDVKGVQKDINTLNGKLERTYIELTMTMKSRINNKEPYIEQGLFITQDVHGRCNEITEMIRKTGSVSREIREIQNQIKQEESRDFSSKIEKLATDMKILQKENSDLAKLLKKH